MAAGIRDGFGDNACRRDLDGCRQFLGAQVSIDHDPHAAAIPVLALCASEPVDQVGQQSMTLQPERLQPVDDSAYQNGRVSDAGRQLLGQTANGREINAGRVTAQHVVKRGGGESEAGE
ncbi:MULTISPECIES: hypothetical protein [unclassified Kribbella]|uniref:hypothetical protein n=1 Tax=unclassified Kribbella TaxID=2644121 RepID=UPI00307765BF